MIDQSSARIEREREVHPHAMMWHASGCMLEAGRVAARANASHFLSSLLLTMFALEAYLNERGLDLHQHHAPSIPVWDAFERLAPKQKIDRLLAILAPTTGLHWGAEPLQTISPLNRLRNAAVHPKHEWLRPPPEIVTGAPGDIDTAIGLPVNTELEAHIQTDSFAAAARDAVEALLTHLHQASPKPSFGLFISGFTFSSATLTPVSP